MAENSAIEWTDATWNPWQGCAKVSPACANCYMFRDMARYGRDPKVVRRSADPTFRLPLKRTQSGEWRIPPGSKVFTCSWSDWFHRDADPWRDEAWAIIRQRPDLIFQVLTKRTERIPECLPDDWGDGYPNVWLMATVENQEWADRRLPELLSVPAAVHGASCEPLLGLLNLRKYFAHSIRCIECHPGGDPCRCRRLGWVIGGGESGPKARPMHPQWARSIRDQCQASGVAFFFKQWGEFGPSRDHYTMDDLAENNTPTILHEGALMSRVGKKAAGRLLNGREWSEFPVTA